MQSGVRTVAAGGRVDSLLANPVRESGALPVTVLRQLPLVTLYLTERCNSRCITCDYWRHGVHDVSLDSVRQLLPQLRSLQTRVVLLSGGEPLLHREWMDIARLLRGQDLKLWVLTSGLSLAKHARQAASLFEVVTVSLDGTQPETYAAIRGLDAFARVCDGVRAAVAAGARVGLRVTLQRANYRELRRFVALAHELGVSQISFLAVDVANPHAFARQEGPLSDLALGAADLPVFQQLITALEEEHADDFASGFILESPRKLRRMLQYFAAVQGLDRYPAVTCNAPEFSAVVGTRGRVQPCFFIPGPEPDGDALAAALNTPAMMQLRAAIQAGQRPECATCVCSLYRAPDSLDTDLMP
jgi:Fe-coproporphyrin III synthase